MHTPRSSAFACLRKVSPHGHAAETAVHVEPCGYKGRPCLPREFWAAHVSIYSHKWQWQFRIPVASAVLLPASLLLWQQAMEEYDAESLGAWMQAETDNKAPVPCVDACLAQGQVGPWCRVLPPLPLSDICPQGYHFMSPVSLCVCQAKRKCDALVQEKPCAALDSPPVAGSGKRGQAGQSAEQD